LVIISEILGIAGGYMIALSQAHLPGAFYIHETLQAVGYVDFFSGFIKVFFFAIIIGWICCYQGFFTRAGPPVSAGLPPRQWRIHISR
jgi:phospholipid/cholesterol/gamma-HCH transport system permease protein